MPTSLAQWRKLSSAGLKQLFKTPSEIQYHHFNFKKLKYHIQQNKSHDEYFLFERYFTLNRLSVALSIKYIEI